MGPLAHFLQGREAEQQAFYAHAALELDGDLGVGDCNVYAGDDSFAERGVAHRVAGVQRGAGRKSP